MSEKIYSEVLTKVGFKIKEYQETKKAKDRLEATDFNFLDLFGPGENKVSELLVFLLNPDAPHGQRDEFLKKFLKSCNLDQIGSFKNISCEKPIHGNRRIDIWIEFSEFTIAIENKIWAYDQENQLLDYSNFLKRQAGEKFLLIYLNPYGLNPSEKSISKKELQNLGKYVQIWSYKKDLFELMDSWEHCCKCRQGQILY